MLSLPPRLLIGITDSGFGGLSLVAEILEKNPDCDLLYLGDLKHAPYGTKSKEEVREIVHSAVDFLIEKGCQAIVLACNTATSVAVDYLRSLYPIPIFGMEPAIKPALTDSHGGKVAVMATSLTLQEDRFLSLKNRVDPMNRVIPVPCPGLADLIDCGRWDDARDYLRNILDDPKLKEIHSVVLGCTHYVFLKDMIRYLRPDIHLFDGNRGTVQHILSKLEIASRPRSQNPTKLRLIFNQSPEESLQRANELLFQIKGNLSQFSNTNTRNLPLAL